MADQNIAVRLKFLIDDLGISNSQFADECNISRPTLSQLVTGRNKKVSDVIISQIHTAYPNLSILWLLFGEGDMWVADSLSGNVNNENHTDDPEAMFPSLNAGNGENCFNDTGESELSCENPLNFSEIRTASDNSCKYSKENPLNLGKKPIQPTQDKDVTEMIKNAEFLSGLANFKEKSRKVIQITIYYDDSTFESFYPGK